MWAPSLAGSQADSMISKIYRRAWRERRWGSGGGSDGGGPARNADAVLQKRTPAKGTCGAKRFRPQMRASAAHHALDSKNTSCRCCKTSIRGHGRSRGFRRWTSESTRCHGFLAFELRFLPAAIVFAGVGGASVPWYFLHACQVEEDQRANLLRSPRQRQRKALLPARSLSYSPQQNDD